jgi:alcohol dehydrogenase
MAEFHFSVRPKVWIGPDSLLRLPLLAAEYAGNGQGRTAGPSRALLIADPLLYESKMVDRVRALLEDRNVQVLVFDEIPDRATSRAADDALRLARGSRSPLIVALGGLKTMMIARAVAFAAGGGKLDIDAILDSRLGPSVPVPLIEIPTSLRHPFMVEDCVVLTDGRDRRARLVRLPAASPSAVLVDPGLSSGLPPKMAASCVIDGLMGAVEGYVSSRSSFMSDILLERAVSSLAAALDALIARPDDPQARSDAWRGAFLASIGQGLSAPGIGTAVSIAVNARYPVPKASLAAILLPYSMESAAKSRLEKIAALCPLLGEDCAGLSAADAAAKSVEWLRTRLGLLKIPSRLKDFDLSLDRLVETARDARELDFVNYLPRAVSVDDVFDFVKTAF